MGEVNEKHAGEGKHHKCMIQTSVTKRMKKIDKKALLTEHDCTCGHPLMLHAVKNVGTGIWRHGSGICQITHRGKRCQCTKATPVQKVKYA
jgi:hypothetical protein